MRRNQSSLLLPETQTPEARTLIKETAAAGHRHHREMFPIRAGRQSPAVTLRLAANSTTVFHNVKSHTQTNVKKSSGHGAAACFRALCQCPIHELSSARSEPLPDTSLQFALPVPSSGSPFSDPRSLVKNVRRFHSRGQASRWRRETTGGGRSFRGDDSEVM